MNEKTTRQIEEMKKQTIGVEIEMNSITRDKAAKIAATYFGTGRFQKRLQHLVSMGFTGQRMEIPERRKHCRMRCRKMRTGNTNPYLRRH